MYVYRYAYVCVFYGGTVTFWRRKECSNCQTISFKKDKKNGRIIERGKGRMHE